MQKTAIIALISGMLIILFSACSPKPDTFTGLSEVGGGDGSGDSINTILYRNGPAPR